MNYSVKRISLDIHSTSSRETVNTKRGDTGRKIYISLVDGGIPYIISEDCRAVFTAKKPDGKIVFNDCAIDNNTIIYEVTEQTVAVEGRVDCEIKLYGADNKLITSAKFTIAVFGTVYNEGDEIESSDEFSALTKLIGDAIEATENANEAAAKAAHTAKSLMVVGKTEGANIYLDDAIEQYLVGLRIFGKTTQDSVPTPDAPVDLLSAGDGGVQVMMAGKNLLQCSTISTSSRGITFSVSPDGTIVANGTATENAYLTIGQVKLHPGKYLLRGDLTGSSTTHRIFITNGTKEFNNYTTDREFVVTESGNWSVRILINAGTSVANLKLYPMVRLATISDFSYERYNTAIEMTVSTPNGLNGVPVSADGNYIDENGQSWICDEIDFTRGVYIKRIGIKTFDGSNDEYWYSENPLLYTAMFRIGILDSVNAANVVGKDFVCTHFAPERIYGVDIEGAQHSGQQFYFRIQKSSLSTADVAGFQKFLASSPITLQYVLSVPVEIALSEEVISSYAAMHTYREHTTISNNGYAHMEIQYVMDAKKYIDSLLQPTSVRIVQVKLLASAWVGSGNLYSQVVSIDGITENSQVNLTPSVLQLSIFYEKDITFITENDGGVVTVYVIGQKPENDYTIQADIVEVVV